MCKRERKAELLKELFAMEDDDGIRVKFPTDTVPVTLKYTTKKQEHFFVITLDGNHRIIRVRTVTVGLVNRTVVHPREVFRPAIKDNAIAIIIGHNHPSGNLTPSPEDFELHKRMVEAGSLMGIPILDDIIVSKKGYYSFLEEGKM